MKTIKREAKVGERILITDRNIGSIQDGDTGLVTRTYDDFVSADIRGRIRPAFHYEYEVIVEAIDDIEARYTQAVEQAREAIEELRLASLAKGYEDARRELTAVEPTPPTAGELLKHCREVAQSTPQQKRDAIVERAKKDVAKISTKWRPNCSSLDYGLCAFNPRTETVNFEVNSEKRTVVCYITYEWNGKTCTGFRGIAKCAPTDCFNAHIGKAISLRRALGLDVPAGFLNAPQPTEVRVGDVVANFGSNGWDNEPYRVDYIGDGNAYEGESGWIPVDLLTILDDTREGVDGE